MIKQEWVDEECDRVAKDIKKSKKHHDSLGHLRFLLLLISVFFCMPVHADNFSSYKDGVWFMCKSCRTCQWQDYKQKNWWGEYFCVVCGEKYQ
jgi:hypothetical protein